jgi:cell division protein FtsB
MVREDRGRTQAGLRRKACLLFSVIVFIALVVGSLFGDGGILELLEENRRAVDLAQELEALRAENGRLAEQIQALRTSPRAIERLAREELGLAGPGETVYLIREHPPTARP